MEGGCPCGQRPLLWSRHPLGPRDPPHWVTWPRSTPVMNLCPAETPVADAGQWPLPAGVAEHPRLGACGSACELHLGGVDVPLRDRRLGVAGFELDVAEGVAGGGFVGEGGVAEV